MNLIIVHYHLRPGGIRRVIELATPHLLRALPEIKTVTLACGEADDVQWRQNFAHAIAPVKLETITAPALGYFSEQKDTAPQIRVRLSTALEQILVRANKSNCLVWAHNLGIGRNLLLTQALTRACAARGITLVSHHHDWWFDNRWLRWAEIRRSGFPTLRQVAQTIFPTAPTVRHAVINQEDAATFARHRTQTVAWLPNLTTRSAPPAPARVRAAKVWLQQQLADRNAPVWILPCRLLRRKNVAEALLLTRWLRPEAWLVTTGGVSSADERAYSEKLQQAARRHHWHLRLGVLHRDETRKPTVAELMASSETVLLTSIQEGFGLPYLEAAAAGRPLIARHLPNIAPDLKKFGFRFPQAYDEILIATELFDWEAERTRQQNLFARWRRNLPAAARRLIGNPLFLAKADRPPSVAFSRLTLTAQLEVLAQPATHSWQLCAPLNPFLQAWQQRAALGHLKLTGWPRTADRWLSGAAYARRFAELLQRPTPRQKRSAANAVQQDFFRKKLCPGNLYPLLWATET